MNATSVCTIHGEHEGLICIVCYAKQQERIERESEPLRYANTATVIRRRVLAATNGFSGTRPLLSTEKKV
jgi:hypothetical protein